MSKLVFVMGILFWTGAHAAIKCSAIADPVRIENQKQRQQTLAAGANFLRFFDATSKQFLERDFVLKPMMLSILAQEHMLLIGPPGTAKTSLPQKVMSSILDKDGNPSFFSQQMTTETSLGDTHGNPNYKEINETGRINRFYDEGILGSRFALLDEQFDMRPNGYRNILDVLAQRQHAQGNKIHKGITWTVIGSSNTYLPEVFAKFDGSEQPRALIDRYAYVVLVPAELQMLASNMIVGNRAKQQEEALPKLTFEEIEGLQQEVAKVEIPEHVSALLSILHYRLRPIFEGQEQAAQTVYRESLQAGDKPIAPYRSTKYMSPRTEAKAFGILRAAVLLDFLQKKGNRKLSASAEDLKNIEAFYTLNGPHDQFLQNQLQRATKEVEREQLKTVVNERKIVGDTLGGLLTEFKAAMTKINTDYKLTEVYNQVRNYQNLTTGERRRLMDALPLIYRKSLEARNAEQANATGETVVWISMKELVEAWVKVIAPKSHEKILKQWESNVPLKRGKSNRDRYQEGRAVLQKPKVQTESAAQAEPSQIVEPAPSDVNEQPQRPTKKFLTYNAKATEAMEEYLEKANMNQIWAFLKSGADINGQAQNGQLKGFTPLHVAVYTSRPIEEIQKLLDKGADPTIKDDRGRTPHNLAMAEKKYDIAAILDPSQPAATGKSALEAKDLKNNKKSTRGKAKVTDVYMIAAIDQGVPHQIVEQIEKGGDVDTQSPGGGYTALHVLVKNHPKTGHITHDPLAGIQRALQEKPNLEIADNEGLTPYLFAISVRNNEAAELLDKSGANLRAVDDQGRMGSDIAREHGWDADLVEGLKHNEALYRQRAEMPRRDAGMYNYLMDAKSIDDQIRAIQNGADPNTMLDDKTSIIHYVAANGTPQQLQRLIDLGARVNQAGKGKSALHFAAQAANVPNLRVLVRAGAKLEAKDDLGYVWSDLIRNPHRESPSPHEQFEQIIQEYHRTK